MGAGGSKIKKHEKKSKKQAKKGTPKASKSQSPQGPHAPLAVSFDFHGLQLEECLEFVNYALDNSKTTLNGEKVDRFHFITGRGNHSEGNKPILKPQVLDLCKKRKFKAYICPQNEGIIIVEL